MTRSAWHVRQPSPDWPTMKLFCLGIGSALPLPHQAVPARTGVHTLHHDDALEGLLRSSVLRNDATKTIQIKSVGPRPHERRRSATVSCLDAVLALPLRSYQYVHADSCGGAVAFGFGSWRDHKQSLCCSKVCIRTCACVSSMSCCPTPSVFSGRRSCGFGWDEESEGVSSRPLVSLLVCKRSRTSHTGGLARACTS